LRFLQGAVIWRKRRRRRRRRINLEGEVWLVGCGK
jgi:hypothetical protein